MISKISIPTWPAQYRCLATLLAIASLFVFATCGGGGGRTTPPPEDNVTITGVMDDGSGNAPIPNAVCRFMDAEGTEQHSDLTDADGAYRLVVPPESRGHVICSPRSAPNLSLVTFSSTIGSVAGDAINSENVTPATTVVADIIRQENHADPEGRKAQLLSDIVTHQDANLEIVVAMAERLYKAMLGQQINVAFGDNRSGDGGDGGGSSDSDVGGASGDAGDGADFSPLVEATCEFVVGDTLATGERVTSAALADFIEDGLLDRPDLAAVADEVNLGVDAEQIQAAFGQVFSQGLGQPVRTLTDDQGHYSLSVPPNMAGYIRCTPKDRERLVLGTYFPGRLVDETIEGQDVNPAATVFGTDIAPRLKNGLAAVQENFRDDVAGLEVLLSGPNLPAGPLTAIRLGTATRPANEEVGLVAFAVTGLFNIFNKNGYDVDFPAAIAELRANAAVTPAFLEAQGIPTDQTQALADLMDQSITAAAATLGTDLSTAWSTGRINLTVMDDADGGLIENATIGITNTDLTCPNCGEQTDPDGQLTLAIGGLGNEVADVEVVVSGVPGFEPAQLTTRLVALASVDLDVRLRDPAIDSQDPTVAITSPEDSPISTSAGTIDIQGTASDDVGLAEVRWSSDQGSSGTCAGTASWSASGILLQEGANEITVTAVDRAGNTTSAAVIVNYEPLFQLTILGSSSGSGSVSDSVLGLACSIDGGSTSGSCSGTFPGGTTVTLDIDPANSIFTGWSGPCSGTDACSFTLNQDQTVTADLVRRCSEGEVSIGSSSAAFPEGGGSGSFEVTAPDDCAWEAFTSDAWITLTSGTVTGSGTVAYGVGPNPGTSVRSGYISVSGNGYNVDQTWSDFIADWRGAGPFTGEEIYRVVIEDNFDGGLTIKPYYYCDGGPYCEMDERTVSDPGAGPITLSYTIYTGTRRMATLTLGGPTALNASHFIRYNVGSGTMDSEPYISNLTPDG